MQHTIAARPNRSKVFTLENMVGGRGQRDNAFKEGIGVTVVVVNKIRLSQMALTSNLHDDDQTGQTTHHEEHQAALEARRCRARPYAKLTERPSEQRP